MQEDKEAVFDTADTITSCLQVTGTVLRNLRVNEERAREAASKGYMNATELADYLVRKGMPFREAHETVGRIVVYAIERKVELQELPLDVLRSFSAIIDQDVVECFRSKHVAPSHRRVELREDKLPKPW